MVLRSENDVNELLRPRRTLGVKVVTNKARTVFVEALRLILNTSFVLFLWQRK